MESYWEKVKYQLKKTLPDHSYRMWIDPLNLLEYDHRHIKLSSPNSYFVKRIRDNYLAVFEEEFLKLGFENITIEFQVSETKKGKKRTGGCKGAYPALAAAPEKSSQADLPGFGMPVNNGRMLQKRFTFDDFIVGKNSGFAYSASLSLAQGKIKGYNILYLLSKSGLGKTHLSQAAGHHIMNNSLHERVYYVTAEDFTNEMIYSIKNDTIGRFKEKYRTKCDVMILEDVHFLSGKEATQKELAITLDYLLDAEKKIIFSGCSAPDDLPKINSHLRSRLNLGLVTEILPPDYATRVRILKKKSTIYGYAIPDDVTEFIAQELSDDVRQLESGLLGIAAKGQLMGSEINMDLARSVISHIAKTRKKITIDNIKKLVCREYALTLSDLVSSSRKQSVVKPRQIAIFLSKRYTDQSIKSIGRSFNRYHATAIHSINTVQNELKKRTGVYEQIKYLSEKIEAGKL